MNHSLLQVNEKQISIIYNLILLLSSKVNYFLKVLCKNERDMTENKSERKCIEFKLSSVSPPPPTLNIPYIPAS
jgi:hypothetical protein